jgi:uncharacterized protein (TIGR00255 family)
VIHSMTGFGDAALGEDGVNYTLEIRSLNNRYFKASIKLPEHLQFLEAEVERLLRSRLGRGSITYHLRVRNVSAEAAYEINRAALEAYVQQLSGLKIAGQSTRVDLAALMELPGVCQPREMDHDARRQAWDVLQRMTLEAMDKLVAMRQIEGRALRQDLLAGVRTIRQHLAEVQELAPQVIEDYYRRLRQRVDQLLGEAQIQLDQETLSREVALFAERCDVNEETARLACHLEQFETLCDSKELTGRKLEFLAQEMLREANTVGSKANNAEIGRHIVEIKAAIDRLKEQTQNVE